MALLAVLLLVALMATVSQGVVDDVAFGLHRAANSSAAAQARWHALAAETFAGLQLRRLARLRPDRTTLEGGWSGREVRYPIDGGEITLELADAGNCFNVNALAAVGYDPESTPVGPRPRDRFVALLRLVDPTPTAAETLTDAIADWTDPDVERTGLGFEDDAYQRLSPPYRTGGGAMADVTELRTVAGMTPERYDALRPYLCALPQPIESALNVNTLGEAQAPLLAAATGVTLSDAQTVIRRRPEAGWASMDVFWADPVMQAAARSPQSRLAVSARTRYFQLRTRVVNQDAEVVSTALLEQAEDGSVKTRARWWTLPE